jgi:transcriptional regulator with XRE-family HTH domain
MAAKRRLEMVSRTVSMIDHQATGQLARDARCAMGAPLREIARRLNCSAAYLSDLELGRRNWTQDKLSAFSAALYESTNAARDIT